MIAGGFGRVSHGPTPLTVPADSSRAETSKTIWQSVCVTFSE
jgi:hypothetical protein